MSNVRLLQSCLLAIFAVWVSACQNMPIDPTQSPSAIRQALMQTASIDPILFDPKITPTTRAHLSWVSQEKQTRLWRQLAFLLSEQDIGYSKRREGRDINAKLNLIAIDKQRRPEVYSRINARYLKRRVIASPSQAVNALNPTDVSEETRLVWESVLLLPYGADVAPGMGELALEAIARIGNPLSIPVLLQFANAVNSLSATQTSLTEAHYRLAAETLLRIPAEASVAALLQLQRQARDLSFEFVWNHQVFEFARMLPLDQQRAWMNLSAKHASEPLFQQLRGKLGRVTGTNE